MVDRLRLIALLSVAGVAAAVVRGIGLGSPQVPVFDEVFYANDAADLATRGFERPSVMHPPAAKWPMAAGIKIIGFDPIGWRLGAYVLGVALVMVMMLAAYELTKSLVLTAVSGVAVTLDGLTFTMGRLAMLDGIAAFGVGVICWACCRRLAHPTQRMLLPLTCLWCGVSIALKWSTIPVVIVAMGVFFIPGRQVIATPRTARLWRTFVAAIALMFAGYLVGWTGALAHPHDALRCGGQQCSSNPVAAMRGVVEANVSMLQRQVSLPRRSPMRGPAWRWLLQDRPTILFKEACSAQQLVVHGCGSDGGRAVVARGNLVVWLGGTTSLLAGALWYRERVLGWLAAMTAALWVPWLFVGPVFSFYGALLVPLLALGMSRFLYMAKVRGHQVVPAAVVLMVTIATVFAFQRSSLMGPRS